MNCKFCQAELTEGESLCPACGKENTLEVVEEITETPVEETPVEETPVESTEAPAEEPAAAPQKKNVLMTVFAVIGVLALVVVLVGAVLYGVGVFDNNANTYLVSDEKAENSRDVVVATAGNVKLTNSELQVYYQQAFQDFYNYYSYYMDLATLGLDTTKPLYEQYYDQENGITWEAYFVDTALNTWHRYAALTMQANEDGFTLDAQTQAYLDTIPEQLEMMATNYGYASVDELLADDMGPACDEDGYMRFINSNYFAGQYFDSLYDKLVPTMEEMEAYYAENAQTLESRGVGKDAGKTVDVRHILLVPQGGTEAENGRMTYTEAEWEACRVEAQNLLDQWAAESGTEEGFAQYAAEYTQDPGSMSNGGLYVDVHVGQMVPEFNDWCFAEGRAYGDTGLVKTDYGYHLMYFVDEHEIWAANVESEMVNERSAALVDAAVEKWPMDVKYNKIVLGQTSVIE